MLSSREPAALSARFSLFRRSLHDPERILLGLVLIWIFLALCFPLFDTDFWWHLRTGELILELGELPGIDWYTYMDSEKPWIDLHWGFQLLVTGLYHVGGPSLVVLFKATTITTAIVVAFFATGQRLPLWLRVLLWFPAFVAITGRGYERPEMLSLLFLASWLWIIHRMESQPRLVWLLPFIQVLWINCHALFILGLVVGGCVVVDRIVREAAKGRWGLAKAPLQPEPATLMWAGVAACVAALCSPYFEQGALFPFELYRKFSVDQDFYSVRIGEFHRPVDFLLRHGAVAFANLYFVAELVLWCLAAASFVWLALYRRVNVFRLLLFVGFSNLAWEATRNTNIFSLVAACVMVANLEEVQILRGRLLATSSWRTNSLTGLFFATLSVLVVTNLWNLLGERNKPFGLGEHPNWFIHSACRFAAQEGFPNYAFVAHNGQAGVFIYHTAPYRKVFMDARLEVCSRKTFELYDQVLSSMAKADGRWTLAMQRDDEGRLPVVILDGLYSRQQIQGMLMTPGWRLVYSDPISAVFLEEGLAEKLSLPAAGSEPLRDPPR